MPNSVYPGTLITYTVKTNKVDLVDAAHVNQLQYDVIAIATALGVNPQGSAADLATRLLRNILADGSLNHGTSFPGSPNTGDWFFRTDLSVAYIWNGSAWSAQSGLTSYAAGSYLIAGPSFIVQSNTVGGMTKAIEMLVPRSGTLRIIFGLVRNSGSTCNGQIYRNGVAVGTLRLNSTATWVEYSEDISGWAIGDLLQIYADDTLGTDGFIVGAVRVYESTPVRENFGMGGLGNGAGPLFYSGPTTPFAALGTIGDLYTNTAGGVSTTLYVKTGASTWTAK